MAAVGIGPLPGIAALVLFNLGVVAKLLSETVDGVDTGPLEAARAAGGDARTQTVRWAVLPQVLPNYVAFSLYAFELNIRASTVIGIVGAGGIGNVLFTQYRFFNWSNVSVIIIELFVFVFAHRAASRSGCGGGSCDAPVRRPRQRVPCRPSQAPSERDVIAAAAVVVAWSAITLDIDLAQVAGAARRDLARLLRDVPRGRARPRPTCRARSRR